LRHLRDVHVHADAPARGRLGGRARQACTTEVLDADDQSRVEQLQAGLDQALLLERVTDLDARPLRGVRLSFL
jgi:hypothetical protein